MRRQVYVPLFVLLVVGCPADPPPVKPAGPVAPTALVYGVAAPLGTELAAKEAAKAAPLLSAALGLPVTARVLGYNDASTALVKGEIDIALVPPLTFVRARRSSQIGALRKAIFKGRGSYLSVIFVRADSKLMTVEDLKGKRIAFVAKGSMSGNLAPRGLLRDRGIDPATFFASATEYADHDAVCSAVAAKQADAGASFSNYAMRPEDLTRGPDLANVLVDGCATSADAKPVPLRTILISEPVPNSVIATRAGFPDNLATKLAEALDEFTKTEPGRAQLRGAFGADGFLIAFPDELDPVARALDFDEGAAPVALPVPTPPTPAGK